MRGANRNRSVPLLNELPALGVVLLLNVLGRLVVVVEVIGASGKVIAVVDVGGVAFVVARVVCGT